MGKRRKSVIARIKEQCANPSEKCEDSGCKLELTGLSSYVVERADKDITDRKMCDCLVFAQYNSTHVLAIVELKSGTTHVTQIKAQLENGAKRAKEILQKAGAVNITWILCFFCLANSWKSSAIKMIANRRVELSNVKHPIRTGRCDAKLLDMMNRMSANNKALKT
jgi:hypothetical protein